MATLPSYETLWVVYPDYVNYPNPEDVKILIGGKVNAAWITNTCAIRMSRALNYSGIVLPKSAVGMNTISGSDKKRYAYRVRELRKWLNVTLDTPVFDITKKAGTVFDKSTIAVFKGIIAFDIAFSDATGHLDLWDGSNITSESHMSKNYYDSATRITVWKSS
ncbi:MAG: type VI secretion system amidase effector protein Tae4 [Candidatus Methylumidiphilus sp.]